MQEAVDWAAQLTDEAWASYQRALKAVEARGVRYVVGGGFAVSAWARRWRDTKDLDLFVQHKDAETVVLALRALGFEDYYAQLPYDRSWISRNVQGGFVVDVIWQMANHRAPVDAQWISRAPTVHLRGRDLPILPIEELIWAKLYIVQRERCDWPDVVNLLYARGADLDWEHLLGRLGPDVGLLGGALAQLRWLCPGVAAKLPDWIWTRVGLLAPTEKGPDVVQARVNLFDSRPWFGPDDR